jgi:hypothetical protein
MYCIRYSSQILMKLEFSRQLSIALSGEIVLEKAVGLSSDRLLVVMMIF